MTLPNKHLEWRVEFSFSVYGHPYQGGRGMAFWYNKIIYKIIIITGMLNSIHFYARYSDNAGYGNVFGGKDQWHGLGLFFDSSVKI